MPLPTRMELGVRDEDALAGGEQGAEDGMRGHVVDGAAGQLGIGPLLVPAQRPHDQPRIGLQQHHVGGVVGNQASQVLEQRIEYDVQLESAGQVEGRGPQDLGGAVAGRGKGRTGLAFHVCWALRGPGAGRRPALPGAGSYRGRPAVNP